MSLFFSERVTEASSLPKIDPDDDLYRSTHTSYRRDLGQITLRRAQELSLDVWRRDPLARRIIQIHTSYLAGTGFSISCDNPDVQAIAEDFWSAERNRLDRHHRGMARDWLIHGELFVPVAHDEMGNVTAGIIDPHNVDYLTRDPRNNLHLETVVLTAESRTMGDPAAGQLAIVRSVPDPMDREVGLMKGEVFAWLYEQILGSTRGTPFLLPVLDWLDAYDQTLWEHVERIKAMRAYFWDVEVDGGETEVAQAEKDWGITPPRSGSVRFRTKALQVKAESPQLGGYEDVNSFRYLLRHIASGVGLTPHWLSDPEDANRSTAEQMDQPVLRSLQDLQSQWQTNMEDLVRYAVDRKIAAGMLPRVVERHSEDGQPTGEMVPARETVEIVVPQIQDADVVAAAGSLAQVANAFAQLEAIGATDIDTIRKVTRRLIIGLGINEDELPDPDDDDDGNASDQLVAQLIALEQEAKRAGFRALEKQVGAV